MNNELNIQRKEGIFFTTLSFRIPDENLVSCASSVLQEVIKKYSLPEQRIVDIRFSKINEEVQKFISVVIEYCNFDPHELENLDKAEQIRFVLKFMGYTDDKIKDISYRKYWSNSNELIWVARVSDPNYDFDPDESYSERDYSNAVHFSIKSVLNFRVIVDFI